MHQGEFVQSPCCPLWGWCSAQRIKIAMIAGGNHTSVSCREAAKGVLLVTLSGYHSTGNTPSVRPFGLPAPPPGSQVQPPLKGLAGVAVLDGVQPLNAELRTAHRAGGVSGGTQNTIMETHGESAEVSLAPPMGELAGPRGLTERATAAPLF